MLIKDIKFTLQVNYCLGLLYTYLVSNNINERITVLDTQGGHGIKDIETGYRDSMSNFWLVKEFDIRNHPDMTIEEAIEYIKANSYF